MKIEFTGRYKSITRFESDEMKEFVVVTGKNGSGKSQLIEAIQKKLTNDKTHSFFYEVKILPQIVNPQFGRIEVETGQSVSSKQWEEKVRGLAADFLKLQPEARAQIKTVLDAGYNYGQIRSGTFEIDDFVSTDNIGDTLKNFSLWWSIGPGNIGGPPQRQQKILDDAKKQFKGRLQSMAPTIFLARDVAIHKQKDIDDLEENDYFSTPIHEIFIENQYIFHTSVESIFFNYARKRNANDLDYYRKDKYGYRNNSIADTEFVKLFIPPWDQINGILRKLSLNYSVPGIDPARFTNEYIYHFHLIKNSNSQIIQFADLSSGEKIIIGLILKLFLSQSYAKNLKYPDYLFLDEPDAHLHPEMSKLLIDVLYETFVNQLGIKVLITTHSPSTVALAPEESIYEIRNEPITELRKVDKDSALKILTENLPTLTIDYKNHRQIFVESPIDQYYYSSVFNKLKLDGGLVHQLYFIASAMGRGNCDLVNTLVKAMRDSNNRTSFGVIDWDLKNNPTDFVKLHGHNNRYSIENYILDPIYLVALFIEQKLANHVGELGFDETYSQHFIGNESQEKLQEYANWLINKVYEKKPILKSSEQTNIHVEYSNGKKISLPQWFVSKRGHDLEPILRETFPSLSQFPSETELYIKMAQVTAKCYPFVPIDTISLLKELANMS